MSKWSPRSEASVGPPLLPRAQPDKAWATPEPMTTHPSTPCHCAHTPVPPLRPQTNSTPTRATSNATLCPYKWALHQRLLSSTCGQFCPGVTLKKRATNTPNGNKNPQLNTMARPCQDTQPDTSCVWLPLMGKKSQTRKSWMKAPTAIPSNHQHPRHIGLALGGDEAVELQRFHVEVTQLVVVLAHKG